ncbi:MAG TPA: hypothetical protein VKV27_03490 [Solirubrobacteraceae bacterium]|nr:hypothetical protein [Solirubrobacteraceae bacterium]
MRKLTRQIALTVAALALGSAPAVALASTHTGRSDGATGTPPRTVTTGRPSSVPAGPPSSVPAGPPSTTPSGVSPGGQGSSHRPTGVGTQRGSTPGPGAGLPAVARAYGRYCRAESRDHVAGQRGTPFSQCVVAMARVATGASANPTAACATESRHHVAGQRGTPFSVCVSGAAKLLGERSSSSGGGS